MRPSSCTRTRSRSGCACSGRTPPTRSPPATTSPTHTSPPAGSLKRSKPTKRTSPHASTPSAPPTRTPSSPATTSPTPTSSSAGSTRRSSSTGRRSPRRCACSAGTTPRPRTAETTSPTRWRKRGPSVGTDGRGSLGAMWLASPAHARWLENEFDALAGFASEAGTAHGFGYLDGAGEVIAARGHDLFLTCRTTPVFAHAHLLGRPGAASQVDHGIRSLTASFADPRGGWFSALAADGTPTDETKAAYAHAFVILAAASATEAERPGGRDLLGQALAVSEEHFWREEEGMV